MPRASTYPRCLLMTAADIPDMPRVAWDDSLGVSQQTEEYHDPI
jgi:hypothetical protein